MYNNFKALDKYTLKKTDAGIEKLPQSKALHHLSNDPQNIYDIWLTRCDGRHCDTVKMIGYNPGGNIQEVKFEFKFYDYINNIKYVFVYYYVPAKSGFWKGISEPGYWKVEIKFSDTPNIVRHSRGFKSEESKDIGKILEDADKNFREKIVYLIKNYKYNRITICKDNLILRGD